MKRFRSNDILTAIALLVIGMLFVVYKSEVISIAMSLIAITLGALGIVDILHGFTVTGVVKIILALLVLATGWLFISIALYILGACLLVAGISELYTLSRVKIRRMTLGAAMHIAQPVIYVLIAICLFCNQGGALSWVFTLSGVFLIIDGVVALIGALDNK